LGQYLLVALLLPAVALLHFIFVVLSKVWTGSGMDPGNATNSVLAINQGVLISFANLIFVAFDCYTHPNGQQTLSFFPAVSCHDADYKYFMAVAVFMIFTVLLPFNAFFVYAILAMLKYRRDQQASMRLLGRCKIFFKRWRPERWFWGYVFVLRQVFISLVHLFAPNDGFVQSIFMVSILVVYCVATTHFQPWKLWEMNIFETVVTLLIVLALMFGVTRPKKIPTHVSERVLIIMFITMGLYCLRIGVGIYLAKGLKGDFAPLPKPIDKKKMDVCLEAFCNSVLSSDDDARKIILESFTEADCIAFENFFESVQYAGLNSFDFGIDAGYRPYFPSDYLATEDNFENVKRCLAKNTNAESLRVPESGVPENFEQSVI